MYACVCAHVFKQVGRYDGIERKEEEKKKEKKRKIRVASEMPTVERNTMILCARGSSGMHSHTKGNKWSLHGVQLLIKTHSFVHYSFHPHSTTK